MKRQKAPCLSHHAFCMLHSMLCSTCWVGGWACPCLAGMPHGVAGLGDLPPPHPTTTTRTSKKQARHVLPTGMAGNMKNRAGLGTSLFSTSFLCLLHTTWQHGSLPFSQAAWLGGAEHPLPPPSPTPLRSGNSLPSLSVSSTHCCTPYSLLLAGR